MQAGFIAPPGRRLLKRDLSQIELRSLAHLSGCRSMIEVYEADGDIHTDTCWKTGLTPRERKPTVAERLGAKRCNFSCIFGVTGKGLYLQLVMDFGGKGEPLPDWLTEEWCGGFVEEWLDSRPEVREYIALCHYRARRYGYVWEPFGRVRLIPELISAHSWIREAGLRQAQNFAVTSFAAGMLKLGMGKTESLFEQLRGYGLQIEALVSIHDAILAEVAEEDVDTAMEALEAGMDTVMHDECTGENLFRVPMRSDGDVMERWH